MENSENRKSDKTNIAHQKTPLKSVGEFLREARQGRNLSLEDLSSSIRIGKEQLIALESGDENALPEKVFIRAMVRRIAEKLSLDTSFILEKLNEKKLNEPNPSPIIKKKNIRKNRALNPLSMIILSGALGLFSSIILLKYIQGVQNDSIKLNESSVLLLDKSYTC